MVSIISFGILFALLAALSSGIEKILRRHAAIKIDAITYVFYFNLIASLAMLPIYLSDFMLPSGSLEWALLLIPSALFAGTGFFLIKAYSHLESSVAAPITNIKIFIVLALSIIFLGESLTLNKVLGTFIVFGGLAYLKHKKTGKVIDYLKNKGFYFILISVLFTASGHIFEKAGLNYLNPGIYAFFVYFIPFLIFVPFYMRKRVSFKTVYRNRFWTLTLTALLSTGFHYFILLAFTFMEASLVLPFSELSSLFAVIGGIIFLKERSFMRKKIIATIVIILGAILVSMA